MASFTWILLSCMLLFAVPFSTGLEFYITRTPGSYFCANTQCSYDANEQDGAKITVEQISIYDVTHPGNKFQLACRKNGDAGIYLDPTKAYDINGTAGLTKFHADIHLDFRNPTDCLYETILCEVVYVDGYGKKQTVRKTIAPDTPDVDSDCSCSSITYRLDRLTNRANGATRQLYGLTLNLDNLEVDLNGVRNGTTELSSDIARLQESHEHIQISVNELRDTDREIDAEINDLKHVDSVLESRVNDLQHADEDIKQTIVVLKQNDKNTDKLLTQLTRTDNSQLDQIETLQQTNGVVQEDIDNLRQSDTFLEGQVGGLRNESGSLRNQIVQLRKNDNSLRAEITVLSSHDSEIQGSITELRRTDDGIDRQIAELNRNDINLLEDTAQMQQATSAKRYEINELSQTYSDVEAEIKRLKQSDQQIDDRINVLNNKDTSIEKELNALLRVDVVLQQAIDKLQITNAVHQDNIAYLRRNDTAFELRISDLIVSDRIIDTQINDLSSSNSAVRSGITVAQLQQRDIRDELDRITNQVLVIESQVQRSQITTVSRTTSALVLTSCTRGMPHDTARANIILYGSIPAVCDTETDGGGWVIIQRRTSGDEKFYRPWSEYKHGFGNPESNYYIGNDIIYNLTAHGFNELRIDLVYEGKSYYAHYSKFSIDGEESKYRLHVADYEGTAPDSFSYQDGCRFSTYDEDNDSSNDHCAKNNGGAWWYNDCYGSNLDGVWGANDKTGVIWKGLSEDHSVTFSEMKVRYCD